MNLTQIVTYKYQLTHEGVRLFLDLMDHFERNKNIQHSSVVASKFLRKYYLREAYEAVSFTVAYT